VSQVVAAKELMPTAMALAERIAKGPAIAIELTKRLAYQGWRQELECQTEYEEYLQRLCIESEDVQEGIRSFLEKREPIFKGR
jgi:enoyl-CoA hydratase/carnithine racemase